MNDPAKGVAADAICRCADRVPKVRLGQNQKENNARVRQKTAIVSLYNHCLRNPGQAEGIWSTVTSDLIAYAEPVASKPAASEPDNSTADEIVADRKSASMSQVDDKWKAGVLKEYAPTFTYELMNLVADKDSFAMQDIWVMFSQTQPSDKLTLAVLKDETLLYRTLFVSPPAGWQELDRLGRSQHRQTWQCGLEGQAPVLCYLESWWWP
jgi:hypothetical protein